MIDVVELLKLRSDTISRDAVAKIEQLRAEHEEDQAVIRVWRGRTERAEAELELLRKENAELKQVADWNISLTVIRQAYGWAVDIDGKVLGLVAGDMGYEETGIVIDTEHRDASHYLVRKAEDEVQRLQQYCMEVEADAGAQFNRAETAKARLADAVEVLRDCIALLAGDISGSGQQVGVLAEARAFLAKLEGRS